VIAALFVEPDGAYFNLDGVDPWDERRDARLYAGPWPVVAHPPCERWGKFWYGCPSREKRFKKGDDGGCFEAALAAVERWGGVLEHPEGSNAWKFFDIAKPPKAGGWIKAGLLRPGWTCRVDQGNYGHRALKPTWLYAVGVDHLPALDWAAPEPRRPEDRVEMLWKPERQATPPAFRDLLLEIARGARR
jgi:hypothetical protein